MTPSESDSVPTVADHAHGDEHRLHPYSLLFSLGAAARRLLIPGLVVLFASRGGRTEIWLMAMFVPSAVYAITKYVSLRYRFDREDLVLRGGIVTRFERHVPYARIQNIDYVQTVIQRLLKVADVKIETAGGTEPEAHLQVLSLDAVEDMRDRVFARRGAAPPPSDETAPGEPAPVLSLSWRDLVLYGIVSNRGMVVVAAALGLIWQFDVKRENIESAVRDLTGLESELIERAPWPQAALLIGLTIVAVIVFMRLLSIAFALVRFHGFTLRRNGDDLRTSFGLLTRVSATIPRHRIQVLSLREALLHRWLGRVAVQVETAGGGRRDDGGGDAARQAIAPILPVGELPRVLREIQPDVEWDDMTWFEIPLRAWRRVLVRRALRGLILVGVLTLLFGPWALTGLAVVLPWTAIVAHAWTARFRYGLSHAAIASRSGWLARTTNVARLSKIQNVSLTESLFDRRWQMATLHVDTAGPGGVAYRVTIPFLPRARADELLDHLNAESARHAFQW